jgi:hypothetical protein
MTGEYGRAVIEADGAVRRLVSLAERAYGRGTFSLSVTAAHGGQGTNHGSDDPRDVTIPWTAWTPVAVRLRRGRVAQANRAAREERNAQALKPPEMDGVALMA